MSDKVLGINASKDEGIWALQYIKVHQRGVQLPSARDVALVGTLAKSRDTNRFPLLNLSLHHILQLILLSELTT